MGRSNKFGQCNLNMEMSEAHTKTCFRYVCLRFPSLCKGHHDIIHTLVLPLNAHDQKCTIVSARTRGFTRHFLAQISE